MTDKERLVEIAAALADGSAVDWESAARSLPVGESQRLLAELQFIAGIAGAAAGGASRLAESADAGGDRSPSEAPAEIGPTLGSWGPLTLLEHVGRGSFGDVYRAWDSRLDREVALKILRRPDRADETSASTVVREGRLLAKVRHPNVVTVYGAERVEGRVGVWMEFVHGRTLEQALAEDGPFAIDRLVETGIQLAGALAAVHRAGLIHGDVKTHNVICAPDGRPVLTDFGAGLAVDDEDPGEPSSGRAATPLCVAPEVLAGSPPTASSDVYSLGVLLYRLATGGYPVRGQSLGEVREAHTRGRWLPLGSARSDLPPAFARVVDRALSPHPQDRYGDPDALRADLEPLLEAGDPASATGGAGARRTWTFVASALALAVVAAIGTLIRAPGSRPPAIAVLPFTNLGAGSSDYFVDGLTDEIIGHLAVIDGLDVRSRTSSFMFKGMPRDVRDVGDRLRVDFVLEGSVLRSGDRLRVNAQLVRAAGDVPVWSARFDRDSKDVFAVQDEISRAIVNELRMTLGRGRRRYDTNLPTYDLYLQARALVSPHAGQPDYRRAVGLFERAIASDPSFAPAYAGLAEAWAMMSISRAAGATPDEALGRMQPAAETALRLDPLLAEAHAAMGVVFARQRRWAEAEAAFARALDLNATLSPAHISLVTSTLWPQGKIDESLRQLDRAARTDPLSLDLQRTAAWVLISARRYDESVAIGRRVVAADPGHEHGRQQLGRALFLTGEHDEGIEILEQLGDGSYNFLEYAYGSTGRRAEAEALLPGRQDTPVALALIHAGLGDRDLAFAGARADGGGRGSTGRDLSDLSRAGGPDGRAPHGRASRAARTAPRSGTVEYRGPSEPRGSSGAEDLRDARASCHSPRLPVFVPLLST